jgi:tetratricopeptide (TPR) repeat protein
MSMRGRTKRRLAYVAISSVLLLVLASAAYVLRSRQISQRLALSREAGVRALAAGNYEAALHNIGTYVQRNSGDVEALYQYAQAREKVPAPDGKHVGQSIALYRQLLTLRPTHTEARRRLMGLYVDYGFNQEAIETAVSIDPAANTPGASDDPDVLRAQAKALARLRRYDDAYKAANAYNAKVPRDLDMQGLTLEILLTQGRPATVAVDRASDLQKKFPDEALFELLLGIAHRLAGDGKTAEQWVAKAAARTTNNDPAFIKGLVEQLESLERFEDSLRVLTRAADIGAAENKRLLAARLWQAKRYQEVIDRLKGVDPSDRSSDSELLALRAMALLELGRRDEAAPIVDALVKRFDGTAEAWAPVLKTVFAPSPVPHGDVIRACSEAVARIPSNPYFRHFLANAYSAVAEQDHALAHWAQAAQLSPAWAAPRVKVAQLMIAAGRPGDAVPLARVATTRDSDDVEAWQTLADALAGTVAPRGPGGVDAARAQAVQELGVALARLDALRPRNESTVPLKPLLLAAQDKPAEAIAAVRAALSGSEVFGDATYVRLAAVSRTFGLGTEEACLARGEQAHGRMSPALAGARARNLLRAGKADEGKRVLAEAEGAARDPADVKAWRTAWVTYLDSTDDPAAGQAWESFANDFAEDAQVQSLVLRAASVRADRGFLDRTIERLRTAAGETAVGWRVARARWLAEGATGNDRQAHLIRAASLLGEVCRDMPDLPEPRILLARCLNELGNVREAIDQLARVVGANSQLHGAAVELAGLLQDQGDFAGAKAHLDRVADDASVSAPDRVTAAALLARGGDTDKALSLMEQLRQSGGPDAGQAVPTLFLAELYRKAGDPAKAKQVCQKLLEKAADPGAIGLLADVLASEGQTEQAEQVLAKLDGAKTAASQKELIRGLHYSIHGGRAKALEQFTAATQAAPTNVNAWRFLTRHHLAGGELEEALAAADRAAKASIQDPGLQALQHLAPMLPAGQEGAALLPLVAGVVDAPADEQAVVDVLKCVAEAKKNPSAGRVLAQVRDIADRYPKALTVQNVAARTSVSLGGRSGAEEGLAIATRAMQKFPNAADPAETATTALALLGRWDEAVGMARQWKQRSPSATGADLVTATAHLALERPKEALAVLEPYVAKGGGTQVGGAPEKPVVIRATALYAEALVASGKTGAAEALLAGRIQHSPQYRMAWIDLASRQLRDFAVAARWLETAEQKVPQPTIAEQAALTEAWTALASRSGVASHNERAGQMLGAVAKRTMATAEATPDDLLAVGVLCEAGGDKASAETAYSRALDKDPANVVAMNNLAMILAERGETATAQELALRAAAREHPRRASFYDTLATVQAKARQWPEAVKSMKAALDLDPTNVGFQIHQAKILLDGGDDAKARDAFDAVAVRPEDPRLSNTDRERLKSLRQKFASGS